MKVKQKLEKAKGKKANVLRGPKVPKKMKLANKLPIKAKNINEPVNVTTPKSSKLEVKPNSLKGTTLNITPKMVQQSVKVLLQLHAEQMEKSKALLLTDKENVFVQIVFMKKPDVTDKRRKYLKLHHNLYGDDPEICLFVSDRKPTDRLKRTPDESIEYSVEYYEEFLKKHQIEGITTIMPVFQFRTEFDSYELRRKLVDRFDLFLCQSNLLDSGTFLKNLGIAWNKRNKIPLVWKFPKASEESDPNFKEQLAELIRTTWFWLKPHGDTVSIRVGTVSMTQEQLVENISHILHQIKEKDVVPGGVANIKTILLKTSKSKAIPLYINLASPNSVPVPVVQSFRPIHEAVEDELSTKPGKKVTVLPTGDVFVTADPNQKIISEWLEELTDEETELFDDVEAKPESGDKVAVPKKKRKAKVESDDSDDEAEQAEQQYFAIRSKEALEESSDEEVEKMPVKKGAKQGKKKLALKKSAPKEKKKADVKKNKEGKKKLDKKKKELAKPVQKKVEHGKGKKIGVKKSSPQEVKKSKPQGKKKPSVKKMKKQ